MTGEQRFKERMTICQKYEQEFEKHGIDRLTIPGVSPEQQPSKESQK